MPRALAQTRTHTHTSTSETELYGTAQATVAAIAAASKKNIAMVILLQPQTRIQSQIRRGVLFRGMRGKIHFVKKCASIHIQRRQIFKPSCTYTSLRAPTAY